ncbi:helix-turn-helix transcriptional regulator [Parasphingorhabdus pacifica]
MRASRLISLLCLLQVRGFMTAAELAHELDVSERTVARDVRALDEAGVPIYAERGRTGGYRLVGGYRAKLNGLHRSEADALFLTGVPSATRDLGMAEAVTNARFKVSAALAPSFRDAPDRVERRFHLDAPQWFREAPAPPLLTELAAALWNDRRVLTEYRRGASEVNRTLDPHGLVLKAGVWYVVARRDERFLVYRADRFVRVEPEGRTFERDERFNLRAFWEQRAEEFARSLLSERIEVRISPTGVAGLGVLGNRDVVAEALAAGASDEQGWLTVTLPVESMEVAYDQMLALGPEVEILKPEQLRTRMAAAAARAAALYGVGQR